MLSLPQLRGRDSGVSSAEVVRPQPAAPPSRPPLPQPAPGWRPPLVLPSHVRNHALPPSPLCVSFCF